MTTLYGIPNCDTVRKARDWLTENGIAHHFHDFKKQGIPDTALTRWVEALGREVLINRKGSTWRQLDEAQRARAETPTGARELMQSQPSLIKRPVVEWPDGSVTVGFDLAAWNMRL